MRVLTTGCTHQQCGKDTRQGYQSVMSMHVQAMRDLGHEVTQRPVTVGDEDALNYDVIIIGQVPWLSIAAHYLYPIIDLVDRADKAGVRMIFSIDDWQFPYMMSKLLTVARVPSRLVRETVFHNRPGFEWMRSLEGMAAADRVLDRLLTRPWPDTMYPAFGWGHKRLLTGYLPAQRHYLLDPTSYTTVYDVPRVPNTDRKRQWVLGALSDQTAWLESLKPGWDVLQAGRPRHGSPNLQESELVAEYAASWGVLSPVYKKIAGSGWWRNRFVYSAMTGAILYADPEEVSQLGDSFTQPLEKLEAGSDAWLAEVAVAQQVALRNGCWTRHRYHDELEGMLRG